MVGAGLCAVHCLCQPLPLQWLERTGLGLFGGDATAFIADLHHFRCGAQSALLSPFGTAARADDARTFARPNHLDTDHVTGLGDVGEHGVFADVSA